MLSGQARKPEHLDTLLGKVYIISMAEIISHNGVDLVGAQNQCNDGSLWHTVLILPAGTFHVALVDR